MLAMRLIDLACRILPEDRRVWGEAMRQEIHQITSNRDTLIFAWGCLWAAACIRINPMKSLVTLGRWSVGTVTAAYGGFHLYCVWNGVTYALGKPDPYLSMLVHHHHTAEAASYLSGFPFIMLYMACMGIFNLAAAFYLIRWRAKPFAIACAGVALISGLITVFWVAQATQSGGLGKTIWGWQFVPLIMLVAAACLFAWMSKRYAQNLLPEKY